MGRKGKKHNAKGGLERWWRCRETRDRAKKNGRGEREWWKRKGEERQKVYMDKWKEKRETFIKGDESKVH